MSTTEELGAGILNKSAELCSLMKAAERDVLVIEKMAEHVRSDVAKIAEGFIEMDCEITELREAPGGISDGYHTFDELYHHRAVLFSVVVKDHRDIAWKSKKHHDGTMYDGMFIVGVNTPDGQATYHYDVNPYWGMFDCEELEEAPEWDGHTPEDAIKRIGGLA